MPKYCCRFGDPEAKCACGHLLTKGFRCHGCGRSKPRLAIHLDQLVVDPPKPKTPRERREGQ